MISFIFMKDLSGCHVENRLEGAGVEAGSQLEALQQWERERAAAGLREGAGRGGRWLHWESGLSVE